MTRFAATNVAMFEPFEKLIFPRLIKNAQMQVEFAKSRLRGRPKSLVGNAYMRSLVCCHTLQRLALLDNTLGEFRVHQVL